MFLVVGSCAGGLLIIITTLIKPRLESIYSLFFFFFFKCCTWDVITPIPWGNLRLKFILAKQ